MLSALRALHASAASLISSHWFKGLCISERQHGGFRHADNMYRGSQTHKPHYFTSEVAY